MSQIPNSTLPNTKTRRHNARAKKNATNVSVSLILIAFLCTHLVLVVYKIMKLKKKPNSEATNPLETSSYARKLVTTCPAMLTTVRNKKSQEQMSRAEFHFAHEDLILATNLLYAHLMDEKREVTKRLKYLT